MAMMSPNELCITIIDVNSVVSGRKYDILSAIIAHLVT